MIQKRYHIIIDLSGVDNDKLKDREGLTNLLKILPSVVDMNALIEPVVVEGIPENPGITGFVIIDHSHISIHTFTESSEALIDIFSCKEYEQDAAIDAVLGYFTVEKDKARIQEVNWG